MLDRLPIKDMHTNTDCVHRAYLGAKLMMVRCGRRPGGMMAPLTRPRLGRPGTGGDVGWAMHALPQGRDRRLGPDGIFPFGALLLV